MPQELKNQLEELEQWAKGNARDARRDGLLFWILKAPAICASLSASFWALIQFKQGAAIAGGIAGACVFIDGIHPRGILRNIRSRAKHDIRILASHMISNWRSRDTSSGADNLPERPRSVSRQEARAKDLEIARKIIRDSEPD
jgi:hypothetical protein